MKNATLRVSDYPVQADAGQSASLPPASASGSANQVVRDFFRRGDRGQYEGGPAERALDSLPSWDLPERAPIIRTPQQQARRVAMMWAEAVLMLGCVAFLVAAALKASSNSSVRSMAGNVAQPTSPARAPTIDASRPTPFPPANPSAAVMARPDPGVPVAVKSVRVASPAPAAAEVSQVRSGTVLAAAPERKRTTVAPASPDSAWQRTPSARQLNSTRALRRTEATTPTDSVAPKRAVAAFPDD